MPILDNVKTIAGRSVWKSPDGQREIYEVVLEHEGKNLKAKTYSSDIPVVGWEGKVDTYEKEGRNGIETFVKQPPKEGGYAGAGSTSGRSYQPKDEKAIQAMFAIKAAISLLGGIDNEED